MRKSKKGTKARPSAQQRKGKIGYYIFIAGDDPTNPDDINVEVLGTLKAAIEEARMELDDDGDVYTVYELVPRARVELPEQPEPVVTKL